MSGFSGSRRKGSALDVHLGAEPSVRAEACQRVEAGRIPLAVVPLDQADQLLIGDALELPDQTGGGKGEHLLVHHESLFPGTDALPVGFSFEYTYSTKPLFSAI